MKIRKLGKDSTVMDFAKGRKCRAHDARIRGPHRHSNRRTPRDCSGSIRRWGCNEAFRGANQIKRKYTAPDMIDHGAGYHRACFYF